jgi:hypothetical protein
MAHPAWSVIAAAGACAALVAGCGDRAERNANAPGSPGTGNPTAVVQPAAPDGPPGGPSGIKGSVAHPGSSGGEAIPGTTGSGTVAGGQPAQPGAGLNGGLGMTGSFPAGTSTSATMGNAADGSPNTTSKNAVGQR